MVCAPGYHGLCRESHGELQTFAHVAYYTVAELYKLTPITWFVN